MNVMTAGSMPLRSTPVKSSALPGMPSGGGDSFTQSKSIGDVFNPDKWGGNVRKGAFAAAYFAVPFAVGMAGGGALPTYGSYALAAGAGLYAGKDVPGMQKLMVPLSGFFAAQASRSIGAFAMNPSLGGALGVGISALILGFSAPRLMQMSQ